MAALSQRLCLRPAVTHQIPASSRHSNVILCDFGAVHQLQGITAGVGKSNMDG